MKNRFFRASIYVLASITILFAISFANAADSTSFNPTAITVKVESAGGVPIGGVIPWFSTSIPKGYLKCDGNSFSASSYPKLQIALGATNVPDLRGVFLRGVDDGKGIDTGRTLNSYEAASSTMKLTRQTKDITRLRHGYPRNPPSAIYPIYGTISVGDNGNWSNWGVTSAATKVSYHDGTGSQGSGNPIQDNYTYGVRFKAEGMNSGGPANVSVMYIIRAK
ncbi:MAG: phage tail protein [Halodesulfovibrio sp.]|uniref:phage tail protein n=1 Tax=Halodesulfovibrio sp. TaxID=1912772 RepID=UPI00359CC11C